VPREPIDRETTSIRPAPPSTKFGRPSKREEVLAGALAVFARDGYTRASIDEIAATASVSTRTIYNHFPDKASLFHSVIAMSAAEVADAQIALMNQYLEPLPSDAGAIEAAFVGFALAWVAPVPEHEAHFALVRQVNAELPHIPVAAVDAWQVAGPRRVLGALARYLKRYTVAGLLDLDDCGRAAVQFAGLTSPANPSVPLRRVARGNEHDAVVSGVRLFLRGALPRWS
jgi:AcrR family transcriptional regulator